MSSELETMVSGIEEDLKAMHLSPDVISYITITCRLAYAMGDRAGYSQGWSDKKPRNKGLPLSIQGAYGETC